ADHVALVDELLLADDEAWGRGRAADVARRRVDELAARIGTAPVAGPAHDGFRRVDGDRPTARSGLRGRLGALVGRATARLDNEEEEAGPERKERAMHGSVPFPDEGLLRKRGYFRSDT